MQASKRNIRIDCIRGLAIILMVMGHARGTGWPFIALFNMPVFFIISGYLFNSISVISGKGLFNFYFRKIKSLWWTYFSWNTIFILLNNVFIKINIYTDNPGIEDTYQIYHSLSHYMSAREMVIAIAKGALMLGGGTKMGGAFWFLTVLFGVSIVYATVEHFIRKYSWSSLHVRQVQAFIAILLIGIGYWLSRRGYMIYGIAPCFSAYILFYLGNCLKLAEEKYPKEGKKYVQVIIVVFAFLCLLCMNHMGSVSLGNNQYENPLFLLCASLAGWTLLSEISYFLVDTKLGGIIEVIGEDSLAVMILHFLSFKLVSLIGILVENKPMYLLAAFPVLYNSGFWWIFYTVVGVSMPILVNRFTKYTKERYLNKF